MQAPDFRLQPGLPIKNDAIAKARLNERFDESARLYKEKLPELIYAIDEMKYITKGGTRFIGCYSQFAKVFNVHFTIKKAMKDMGIYNGGSFYEKV